MTARYVAAPSPHPAVAKRGSMSAPSGNPIGTVASIVPGYWNRGYVSDKHATLRSAAPPTCTAESPRCRTTSITSVTSVGEPLQRFYSGNRFPNTFGSDRTVVQSVSVPAKVASAPTSLTQPPGAALSVTQPINGSVGCSVVTQAADSFQIHGGSATLKPSSFPVEPVRVLGPLQGSVTIASGNVVGSTSGNVIGASKGDTVQTRTTGSMSAPLSPKWNRTRHGSPPPMSLQHRKGVTAQPPVAVPMPLTTQLSQASIFADAPKQNGIQRARSPSPLPRSVLPVGSAQLQQSKAGAKSGSPLPQNRYRHVPQAVPVSLPQVPSGTLVPATQVHSSVRLENKFGSSVSSSCRLDAMMLPGDVLSSVDHGGGRLWDIGRAGGFLGHTFVVTAPPRRIAWNGRHVEEAGVEAIWPKGDVSEIWAVRIIESMRAVGGLHEAETFFYVDGSGHLILIGENCQRAGELFFQDHEIVELWQSPAELRHNLRLDLMAEALDEMRGQIGEFDWSVKTAARAVLTNANIAKGTREAEVAACWQQEPICTSVVIALWQRYLCKLAQALTLAGTFVKPIDLIMRWMPLKADRGLPGELLATMTKSGWTRLTQVTGANMMASARHEMSPRPQAQLSRQATPSSPLARISSPVPIAAQREKATASLTAIKAGDLGRLQGIYENLINMQHQVQHMHGRAQAKV